MTKTRTPAAPFFSLSRRQIALTGLILVVLLLALSLARPGVRWLLWAYNVEQAGRLMDQGMVWPTPRLSDSLPQATDEAALQAALGHLAAAIGWRPDHYYAHRLAGQIHAARQDWFAAVDAQNRARALAPKDPLVHWEASLVFETMMLESLAAPATHLGEAMAAGQVTAPQSAIDTPFCTDQGVASCFIGNTIFVQPVAGMKTGPPLQAAVLFMHPPVQTTQSFLLSLEDPALTFMLGLDPGMHNRGSDGATFRILIGPADGSKELTQVYERTLDGPTLDQGWVADWVDLSSWGGSQVTLRLETDPGPAGDSSADWVGWGDLTLTHVAPARLAAQNPYVRMQEAWRAGGLGRWNFQRRVEEANRANQPDRVAIWQRRLDLAIE